MEKIRHLEKGEIVNGAYHSVFVIIYSRRKNKICKTITREIPGLLTIFRSDGRLGFPGGRSESKDLANVGIDMDSLKNTVIRETQEEIGYDITQRDHLKFESSTLIGKNQITTFSYLVTDMELNTIYREYTNIIGDSFNDDELFGLNRLYFPNSSIKKNILKQNFKPSARNDIEALLTAYF